jgi:hypothetical protein
MILALHHGKHSIACQPRNFSSQRLLIGSDSIVLKKLAGATYG